MSSVQAFPEHSSSPRPLSSPIRPEDMRTLQVSGATRRSLGGKQFVTSLSVAVVEYPDLQKVTDAVHARGSFIFLQLWALGRAADYAAFKEEGSFDVVAPSPIPLTSDEESATPRELTVAEIKEYVQLYAKAARNAIEAGFDGVEVHAANGYLLDQFLQSESNKRTDEYGGSIQNRIRFPLGVVDAVVEAVGAERTGVRISPWSEFQGKII
jgi:NADPH2 dehydrogenase